MDEARRLALRRRYIRAEYEHDHDGDQCIEDNCPKAVEIRRAVLAEFGGSRYDLLESDCTHRGSETCTEMTISGTKRHKRHHNKIMGCLTCDDLPRAALLLKILRTKRSEEALLRWWKSRSCPEITHWCVMELQQHLVSDAAYNVVDNASQIISLDSLNRARHQIQSTVRQFTRTESPVRQKVLQRNAAIRGKMRDNIPTSLRQQILREEPQCAYCGSTEQPHIDHIKPWIFGGPSTRENLQRLCRSCNLRKHTKTDEEFRLMIGAVA